MFSSYRPNDVTILLKDISGLVTPLGTEERERLIQSGTHYSEMLPIEYKPSSAYMDTYEKAIQMYSRTTADAVGSVSSKIWAEKKEKTVLVSIARAGTSIGVLIKKYIKFKYGTDVPHYTVSIIRGKGIDRNAMNHILERHSPQQIQFVDGWTGKGAIQRELNAAISIYPDVSPGLAVLSDPAHVAEKCGTHNDFLIASSCLNSIVSGLLSRTFLRNDIIGANDYHGAAYYRELKKEDLTYQFINSIEQHFRLQMIVDEADIESVSGSDEINDICKAFCVEDINLVKPSIGETTRVLLRRVPWVILVHSINDHDNLGHLYQLAFEKGVRVIEYPLKKYRACGIIKSLVDI